MSRTSSYMIAASLIIGVLLGFLVAVETGGLGLISLQGAKGYSPWDVSRLSTYRIPDSLTFCGERMPLERSYVRQRMEQAFYIEFSDGQIILDLKRSSEYFPYIEAQLKQMNMPEDLKYLPVAESALRNLVSDRGAAGIWQFTRATARRYGLKVNYYVDERYDFRKSTVAALKYLGDLHSLFGNWTMAAAAYNMGLNGIKRNVRYQKANDYYNLNLNDETSRFVFRIVALKQIMSHYSRYGFELKKGDFYQPHKTRAVEVNHIHDFVSWANSQGASYKDLKYLNPWLLRHQLPEGKWTIELPAASAPDLITSSSSQDSLQSSNPDTTYVVRPGDSLTRIANLYRVSVSQLIAWNNLSTGNNIRPGQKLTIETGRANP